MTVRVEIKPAQNQAAMHVWVYRDCVEGLYVVEPMGSPKFRLLAAGEAEYWETPEASLVVPWPIWSQLPDAIAKFETGQDFGTRTAAAMAELKATKSHLEDMRKLALELALRETPTPFRATCHPLNRREVQKAFDNLRSAGVCESGLRAVQDLIKALGLEV